MAIQYTDAKSYLNYHEYRSINEQCLYTVDVGVSAFIAEVVGP